MNHQPFRDWLLSDENLSSDQSNSLHEHLQACDSCREIESSWHEVELAFQRTTEIDPAPGFSTRFNAHLAEYQSRKRRQQGWVVFSLTILVIASLSGILVSQLWSVVQTPGPYLAGWFSRFVDLLSVYFSLQNLINPFHWDIPVYAFIGIFFLVGIVSFMSVLWLAAYRKLSLARRFA